VTLQCSRVIHATSDLTVFQGNSCH